MAINFLLKFNATWLISRHLRLVCSKQEPVKLYNTIRGAGGAGGKGWLIEVKKLRNNSVVKCTKPILT